MTPERLAHLRAENDRRDLVDPEVDSLFRHIDALTAECEKMAKAFDDAKARFDTLAEACDLLARIADDDGPSAALAVIRAAKRAT